MPPSIDQIFSNTGVQRLTQLITPLSANNDDSPPATGKFKGGPMSIEEFVGRDWEETNLPGITAPNIVFVTEIGGWVSTVAIEELKKSTGTLALNIDNGKAVTVWRAPELSCWRDFTWIVAGPDPDDPTQIVVAQISIGEPLPQPSEIAVDALPEIYKNFGTITVASAKRLGFKYARVELIPP